MRGQTSTSYSRIIKHFYTWHAILATSPLLRLCSDVGVRLRTEITKDKPQKTLLWHVDIKTLRWPFKTPSIVNSLSERITKVLRAENNSRIALSTFAQAEEHGDLPLRVVSDANAINGSHDSTAMDIDNMAITSSPSTSSTEQITMNPTNMSETFTNNPLKRQNSSDEESRVQVSTKRTRPR
jgi:hypothetical protein